MSAIRDRSVVRSSVIPSAKYCCSGSLLRLANGSTTIERRGATGGRAMGLEVAATAAGGADVVLIASQTHQAAIDLRRDCSPGGRQLFAACFGHGAG